MAIKKVWYIIYLNYFITFHYINLQKYKKKHNTKFVTAYFRSFLIHFLHSRTLHSKKFLPLCIFQKKFNLFFKLLSINILEQF